jgi:hypothetical protein
MFMTATIKEEVEKPNALNAKVIGFESQALGLYFLSDSSGLSYE